jgi:hypothetical protein
MLLPLLIGSWLAIVAFTLIVCRAASLADTVIERAALIREPVRRPTGVPGLVVWDEPATVASATACAYRRHAIRRRPMRLHGRGRRAAAHR